jgi:hypothetical protein
LPELGLVGVVIFGSMIYFNYRDTRMSQLHLRLRGHAAQTDRDRDSQLNRAALYGNAILGGMIGYLVTSTFISTLWYPTFWIMMGLAVALKNTMQGYTATHPVIGNHGSLKISPWMQPRPLR